MTDPHGDGQLRTAGEPLSSADAAVVLAHGRGATAESILQTAEAFSVEEVAYLAPQAQNNTWYPNSFLEPVDSNEPGRTSGLAAIDRAVTAAVDENISTERVLIGGFSQGACLASEWVARNPARYGGLAALSAGGSQNFAVTGASLAHLMVYGFMNTGAFLFIAMTEYWGIGRRFEDFAGLSTRAPVACLAMTVFMFSLAGLPPFGGFFSKYFLFMGAVGAGFWWLAAVGAVNSTLSLFYYSRVVKAMWLDEPNGNLDVIESRPTGLYAAVIVAGVATLLLLPAFGPVIETAEAVAASMF